jgi:RNA polymerase sigma-70 factor (ECF subfamily)
MSGPDSKTADTVHPPLLLLARPFCAHTEPSPAGTAAGPLPSFRELYEEHFAFTWRSLRYLGVSHSQLDDAVQDLWIAVHRRLADFEGRSNLQTWLFGIAVNVQRNLHRTEQRRGGLVPLPSALISPLPDPMLAREAQEAWLLVEGFLATLDDLRRAVFVASLLEGMTPAETAEATGLEVSAVYHRVRSLRQSFRLWVAARGGEP